MGRIVDGKQRLQAVRLFLRDELAVFGYTSSQYKDKLPIGCTLIFAVNELTTRREVLQWYLDLNDGGIAHTSEEIEKVRNLLKKEGK